MFIAGEPEPVAADDRARVQQAALADADPVHQDHPGRQACPVADGGPGSDHGAGADHHGIAERCLGPHNRLGANLGGPSHTSVVGNAGARMNSRRNVRRRVEVLRHPREHGIRVGGDQHRRGTFRLKALFENHRARAGRPELPPIGRIGQEADGASGGT